MNPEEYITKFHEKYFDNEIVGIWPTYKEDQMELIRLIEDYDIHSVLEVGTWKGWTGLAMALHPNINRFKAIDINEAMEMKYNHGAHKTDDKKIGFYLKNCPKAELEFCDSLKFKSEEKFDMVFIDADHEYSHVKSDTENIGMKNATKLIVWHDYPNGEGVRIYLDGSGNFKKGAGLIAYREI